jgi:hypothetical protein
MAGLVPAIHVLLAFSIKKTWMAGTRPDMTMDSHSLPTYSSGFMCQSGLGGGPQPAIERLARLHTFGRCG